MKLSVSKYIYYKDTHWKPHKFCILFFNPVEKFAIHNSTWNKWAVDEKSNQAMILAGVLQLNAQYLIFLDCPTSLKSVTNMPSSNQIYWSLNCSVLKNGKDYNILSSFLNKTGWSLLILYSFD